MDTIFYSSIASLSVQAHVKTFRMIDSQRRELYFDGFMKNVFKLASVRKLMNRSEQTHLRYCYNNEPLCDDGNRSNARRKNCDDNKP